MVKQWQDIIYQGRHSNSYMDSVPDFAAIAEAYGHVVFAFLTQASLNLA
ncbi:acetolactate synthase large subunit [Vibrio maritimus]|uniref:Acetolactate synthase large subunit n=1 Tax=Vibrio maritimus TaxID=990268 RepID=A0A090T920_9VIBR|nr:acetolactate synthase large subunit [Vibrio maritimus]